MKLRLPDPWMLVAALTFLGLLFVALLGGRIAPHEPIYFVVEHGTDPRPYDPGVVFPFGSDVLGRDIVSLVLAGAQTTLTIVLLGGAARVVAGVLIAALSSWWRPMRVVTESVAELVSAIPATLVALILVKVFVKSDTSVLVFIGALLVIGWAGPYRVVRAEVDRLAHAPFTLGAVTMGIGRWRLFTRHHLPHLVPIIALNVSQQIVAALVLVAELGVLSVFVGGTRVINVEESMSIVRTGMPTTASITDYPEWGGLLAGARSVEALWTTRWLILVPGIAFAVTAVAVAAIGFALARRYARRDFTHDLRSPMAGVLAAACIVVVVLSQVVPERYAAAHEWAGAARAEVGAAGDPGTAFADAGLRPLAPAFAVTRESAAIVQTGPARLRAGAANMSEEWPRPVITAPHVDRSRLPHARSFVTAGTGGGVVEAPLVYVGRGIVPSEIPPTPNPFNPGLDLGRRIKDYPDDYANVDVRGKVVLLVRFLGVAGPRRDRFPNGYATGLPNELAIEGAIKRGAAAVVYVDPALALYTDLAPDPPATYRSGELLAGRNPYLRMETESPATTTSGVPVVVLNSVTARQLFAPLDVDLSSIDVHDDPDPEKYRISPARDLGVTGRVEVPLARRGASITSYIGEVADAPADAGRVLVWAVRRPGATPETEVAAAVARALAGRRVPFIFVDFDPSVDRRANTQLITNLLEGRRISLVIVLNDLRGEALRIVTPHGDLIPALDMYAEKAGARHRVSRVTPSITSIFDVAPLPQLRTVIVTGVGGQGDLRHDAAALIGYLAGRLALGAEELPR